MKKWFAMILISLMLMTCYGSTLAVVAVEAPEEFSFEMFYSEVGLPYEGDVCSSMRTFTSIFLRN